jgi:predicted dinucleotide-binding enzyme
VCEESVKTGDSWDRIRAIAKAAGIIVAAVRFGALDDVVRTLGDLIRDTVLVALGFRRSAPGRFENRVTRRARALASS